MITSFTFISISLTFFGIYWLNGVVGVGISIWTRYTGITIFIESYNVLMDISLGDKDKDIILDIINGYKEIKKIETISSVPVGAQYMVFITIHINPV